MVLSLCNPGPRIRHRPPPCGTTRHGTGAGGATLQAVPVTGVLVVHTLQGCAQHCHARAGGEIGDGVAAARRRASGGCSQSGGNTPATIGTLRGARDTLRARDEACVGKRNSIVCTQWYYLDATPAHAAGVGHHHAVPLWPAGAEPTRRRQRGEQCSSPRHRGMCVHATAAAIRVLVVHKLQGCAQHHHTRAGAEIEDCVAAARGAPVGVAAKAVAALHAGDNWYAKGRPRHTYSVARGESTPAR